MIPKCPVCNQDAVRVTGREIYPRRPDLYSKIFFRCDTHQDHYVGTHEKTKEPLGVLADAEHRLLKMKCHSIFDPHWLPSNHDRGRRAMRMKCYARLATEMNLTIGETHFGMFTKEQCKQALELIKKWN